MKTNKWIAGDEKFAGKVTPRSGGENSQLGGFDGRDRTIAGPNGVNRTPDIISRPGKHVPIENKPEIVKGVPSTNDGPQFRSGPELKIGWRTKGYLNQKRGK